MITPQERRIICELSAIYLVFGVVAGGWAWGSTMELGTVPQWITALVALFALVVAAIGIEVQRRIARRRAAIDFFLKTEADKHLVEAYDEFWVGIRSMRATPIEEFCNSEKAWPPSRCRGLLIRRTAGYGPVRPVVWAGRSRETPPIPIKAGSAVGVICTTRGLSVPSPIAGAGLTGLILASGGLLGWWRRRCVPSGPIHPKVMPALSSGP